MFSWGEYLASQKKKRRRVDTAEFKVLQKNSAERCFVCLNEAESTMVPHRCSLPSAYGNATSEKLASFMPLLQCRRGFARVRISVPCIVLNQLYCPPVTYSCVICWPSHSLCRCSSSEAQPSFWASRWFHVRSKVSCDECDLAQAIALGAARLERSPLPESCSWELN